MEFVHKSVLFDEAIKSLNIDNSKTFVDGTAGGGGHSREIAKNAKALIAIDQDPDAIQVLHERLDSFDNVTIVQNNFDDEVVERDGKRVLINERKYFEWYNKYNLKNT